MPRGSHGTFKVLCSFYHTTSRYLKRLLFPSWHSFHQLTRLRSIVHQSSSEFSVLHKFKIHDYISKHIQYLSQTIWQEILSIIGSNTIAMIRQWLLLSFSSCCSLQHQCCICISSFERKHGLLFLYWSEASVRCPNQGTMAAKQANVIYAVEYCGYIGRAVSSRQTPDWTLVPYIVQGVLLLVAPALFAATIYMELGRIIVLVDGEHHSIIKKRWLTKTFVCGDILSFLMQSGGRFPTHSNREGR